MKLIVLCILLLLHVVACKPPATTTTASNHNSQNSLDWKGSYGGILPCADCQGLLTNLTLKPDMTYTLQITYLGKSKTPNVHNGNFQWNKDHNTLSLDSLPGGAPTQFRVGENRLTQLDRDGNVITGDNAADYVLGKINNDIAEKYWKVTELMGKPVAWAEGQKKEPHIILHAANNRVSGSDGCNRILGSYTLLANNRIQFSQMAGTQMACPDMETGRELLKVLQTADGYLIKADTLQLIRARIAPLAKFAAVYL